MAVGLVGGSDWTGIPAGQPAAAADVYASPVAGVRSVGRRAAQYSRTAALAFALLYSTAPGFDAGPLPEQPDTWIQPVPGTTSLSRAATAYWTRAARATIPAQEFISRPTEDEVVYTQDVQGTRALAAAQREAWRRAAHAAQAQPFGDYADGPLAPQPDTWAQATSGTRALRRGAASAWTRAASTGALRGHRADDPDGPPPEPDTWTQPIPGTTVLARTARDIWRRAARPAPFGDFVNGPIGTQPETWTQPIPGIHALRRAAATAWQCAAWTIALRSTRVDEPVAPLVEPTWTQPTAGTARLRATSIRFAAQAVTASRALWTTAQDASGPLPAQPEPWTQPVQGAGSLQRGKRAFHDRAARATAPAQELFSRPLEADVVYIQETQGTRAITVAARTYWTRAIHAAQAHPYGDFAAGPLSVQPDTWTQPTLGTTALAATARARRQCAAAAWQYVVEGDALSIAVSALDLGRTDVVARAARRTTLSVAPIRTIGARAPRRTTEAT